MSPKSSSKRAKPISDSPRRHKRVKGVRGLVRCEYKGGPKLKYDEYADKSLFICSLEGYKPACVSPSRPPAGPFKPWDGCIAVRAINLRDLLTSERPEFRKLASLTDKDLSGQVGCGVFGSKIVFVGGMKPNFDPYRYGFAFGPDISTESYAFDIHDPKQGIAKMAGDLNGGKADPSVFEFAGKLYAVSCNDWAVPRCDFVSFEVFDPEKGTWSVLPTFPNEGRLGRVDSYVIVGTKLFMSSESSPIWCFDLAAQDSEWRRVHGMCRGGRFPFKGRALVVDMPEHSNNKLLFSAKVGYWTRLGVHLMCTDENQESLTKIVEDMPVPAELIPHEPNSCHLLHLGGNLACLVATLTETDNTKPVTHTVVGAAVPFQFQFDISKVDTDRKNCFTLQFQPPRFFEYHSDTLIFPWIVGCFVL